MQVYNFIAGKEYSTRFFEVKSPFYPSISYKIPEATSVDLSMAVSAARESGKKLREMTPEDRASILQEAGRRLKSGSYLSNEHAETAVRLMGMPMRNMSDLMGQAPGMLPWMADQFKLRYPVSHGRYFARRVDDADQIEIRQPLDGFAYSVVPGNDPRATAFVTSVLASVGIPAVLKVSKNEIHISSEVRRALVDSGWPKGAINIVCWDTSDKERSSAMNGYLCQEARVIMPFGSDDTVNEKLRFRTDSSGNLKDNFAPLIDNGNTVEKTVLAHPSGNCAALIDAGRPSDAAEKIFHGAFDYPISCKATKSLFVVGDSSSLIDDIVERVDGMVVGDPLDPKTEVGYVDVKTADYAFNRVRILGKTHNQLEAVCGKRISAIQHTPLIIRTADVESEGLCYETPTYMLTVLENQTLDEAIENLNRSTFSGKKPSISRRRLNVAFFSDRSFDESIPYMTRLESHHRKFNESTMGEKDFALHQGNDYIRELTKAASVSW